MPPNIELCVNDTQVNNIFLLNGKRAEITNEEIIFWAKNMTSTER